MNSYRLELQKGYEDLENFEFFTLYFGKETTISERCKLLLFFREQKISVFYNRKTYVATMSGRSRQENDEYCITLGCKLIQ
jgi:hypothetical protein